MVKDSKAKRQKFNVTPNQSKQILSLFAEDLDPKEIGKSLRINITHVLKVIAVRRKPVQLQRRLPSAASREVVPVNIYSYSFNSSDLHWIVLQTGEARMISIPDFAFKFSSCVCELPGGALYFTGGGITLFRSNEVWCVEGLKDFGVVSKRPMLTKRGNHACVYVKGFLLVFGGYAISSPLVECERFDTSTERWDVLPKLLQPYVYLSAVAFEATNCVYVLGGDGNEVDELKLNNLKWRQLSLRLPYVSSRIPTFTVKGNDAEFFIVQGAGLLRVNPSLDELGVVRTLSQNIECSNGPSYFSNGVLYCTQGTNPPIVHLHIGAL
jgi:hypothetical protein